MSYRYDKEKKRKQQWYLTGILFIAVVFFTPALTYVFDIIEQPLARAWEQSNANMDRLSNIFQRSYAAGEIAQENQELKNRIAVLEVDVLRTQYLESVLESYQAIEDAVLVNETVTQGQVLVHGTPGKADTLLINRGSRDGVSFGDTVITAGNLLIGSVSEVFDTTSRVDLLSKSEQETMAVLFPHQESLKLLGHGKSYRAELPRESLVEVGDTVYSQAEPGRLIAVVREIIFDPRDPFKQVYLSAPVDISNIQTVGVIKKTLN